MKVSGFTLVRNGLKFDYPFLESIRSLLPLVDELVVNVGDGEDETLSVLQQLQQAPESEGKLVLFQSRWPLDDPDKKRGGQILSEQTNLALDRCTGDWCVYLQADEVLHEAEIADLRRVIEAAHVRPDVDGLVFDYVHLYGSFGVEQYSRSVYRREVRALRRASGARSVGDAQSFRLADGSKPRALRAGAHVYHYGWVRTPEAMRAKTYFMDQLYHGDPTVDAAATQTPVTGDNYRYKRFWGLRLFTGSHPTWMRERIARQGWKWDLAHSPLEWRASDLKKIILDCVERLSGRRFFEYRSYRLVE